MVKRILLSVALVLASSTVAWTQNDECISAFPAVTGNNPFDTTALDAPASVDPYDGTVQCAGTFLGDMAHDGWWIWNSGAGGATIVSLCTGAVGFDSDLVVYDGAAGCGGLVQVACNGDGAACPALESELAFNATPATDYFIRIGSWDAADPGFTGSFEIGAPPTGGAGDECALAATAVDGTNTFDTTGFLPAASFEPYAAGTQCAGTFLGAMRHDGWWLYNATATGTAVVSLCAGAAGFDSDLVIYDGSVGCGGLVQIACNGDFGGACGLTSQVSFAASASTDYYIRIGSWGATAAGAAGTFDISYACTIPPTNNDCASAIVFTTELLDSPFDTACATNDGPTPTCGGTTPPIDSWWRYDATASGVLFVETAGSLFNTRVAAYSGPCGALTEIVCGAAGSATQISFSVVAGTSYFLQVAGLEGASGSGDLTTNLVIPLDTSTVDVVLVNGEGDIDGGLVDSRDAFVAALSAAGLSFAEVEPFVDILSGCPTVGWIYNNGTFPDDDAVDPLMGILVRDCVLGGKSAYISGNDIWGFLPDSPMSEIDGVNSLPGATADGGDLVTAVSGIASSALDGFASAYTQDQVGSEFTDDLVAALVGQDLLGDNAALVMESPIAGIGYNVAILYLHDDAVAPSAGDVYSTSIEPAGLEDPAAHLAQVFGLIGFGGGGTPGLQFRRGDVNHDGGFNIADAVALLTSLFVPGSPAPSCAKAADANDDGVVNIADAVYMLSALFVPGSPATPAPGSAACGPDPTADPLTCGVPCV